MDAPDSRLPTFRAPFAPPDDELAASFLAEASRDRAAANRIDARARRFIEAIRSKATGLGGVEDFLHAYSLSTKEGLALMVLAEALLRVPDAATADRLVEDKLAAGRWLDGDVKSTALLVSASAWTLGIAARVIHPGETPQTILDTVGRRLGLPAMRAATRQAMRLLGSHFVIGQDIGEALTRAGAHGEFRYSFDMLGEGARTAADAEKYFDAYAAAIAAIGANPPPYPPPRAGEGISVKLSALHPRYEAISRDRVLKELTPSLIELARLAKAHDLQFTVDAEEADRLELSLDIIGAVLGDASLAGWDGFGLAVQAYQKRALAVIGWAADAATAKNLKLTVRLVKGAYWDTEIKRAQERGLPDYPVFTRKAMTDLCYMACVKKLLASRNRLYPQFASHNALTVASVIEHAGGIDGFEFQRLYGMGEALYAALLAEFPGAACRVYAPVGNNRDLLAYLVRRLLENGANSSFVAVAADPNVPIADILRRPQDWIGTPQQARNRKIPLPRDLYRPQRRAAAGVEFGERASLDRLLREVGDGTAAQSTAAPLVDGVALFGIARVVHSPIDGSAIGTVREADEALVRAALAVAEAGFAAWSATPVEARAATLERAADGLENNRGRLLALLQNEAGKTLDDALAELREAVDYCRYYAAEARGTLMPQSMPGPTGESNELRYRGRGVFVCISPWNFPLAIFLGQVAAALVAGNAVVAKPAEQTPLIAALAIALLHDAGVPKSALHLLPGDGAVGARLVADPHIAGVVFTGSTEVGRAIARALAAKTGPIVPLIAETGGINAMIVDATALPEQVADDAIASAFRSAGQRCSALRLICLQADVADRMLDMLIGAARELKVGDPRDIATHVGPVIDAEAKTKLESWIAGMERAGRLRFRWDSPLPAAGTFIAPAIVELDRAAELDREIFGPVLHVVRWRAEELEALLDDIASNGTALTLGIHSRIDLTVDRIAGRLPHGNIYVNRNMIGAVVGTQPFGGTLLSGTGPKAGGPNYLRRFATEQVVTVNTAAAGGNAGLLAQDE